MRKKKILIIILILLIVVAASYYFYKQWWAKETSPHIFVSGNIETTEVKVSFKIPGKISKLPVDEGYIVKEREIIAKLEDGELIDLRNKSEAALEALQAKVPTLLTTIEKEEKTSSDEINKAESGLRAVQSRLAELLSGSRPQEIEAAKAEVERATSELEKTEKFYARAKHLVNGGYVAVKDWDTAKEAYEVAHAMHKKALENYALVKEGPRKEEIERAKAQVEEAKSALSLAQSRRLQVKVYRQELDVLKAQIKEAKAALEVAKRQLEYSEVFAPVSGVVLVKSVEPGEYVSPGATVVTLADLDRVWLKAYVDETDLGRVKLGQKAKIKTDTFPGKAYEGRISFISSEAEFTPKQVQTQKERVKLVYRIKIDVENRNRELKPGMPADGEILIER
ncbi:MAG: efflux RND transporter periplasmic adaptor subunit [Deltaproteobacteria bacterium]|nr:efflux RND transporter periplasmic adaptor subunit [Deltaproteobacteria bacterium]